MTVEMIGAQIERAHAILDSMNVPDGENDGDDLTLVERLNIVAAQWERRQRGNIYGLNELQITRLHAVFNVAKPRSMSASAFSSDRCPKLLGCE